MGTNPHHPQARGFTEERAWPRDQVDMFDYSRDFSSVFRARLSYCQGLAAHLAQCPGLGYGWLFVTWARLAPLFAQGNATVSWSIQMARRYVLDRLWWTRTTLEAARTKDPVFTEYDQIGWIARVLVSGFSHRSLQDLTATDAPCLGSFLSIHMRYMPTQ